jgi:uncharacterized protein (DUF1499 family)
MQSINLLRALRKRRNNLARIVMLASVALILPNAWTATVTYKTPMLAPCPTSPNCVSSDSTDDHAIAALKFSGSAEKAWQAAKEALLSLPRTRIVAESGHTLHAECKSAIFRFVDDVNFELRPDQGIIAVRSASRVGYSDLGVNRRRIEAVRSAFNERMSKN